MKQTSYVNERVIGINAGKRKIFLVLGAVLSCFFLFGIVSGILGTTQGLREGLPVYIIFFIPSVFLLLHGVRLGGSIDAARRYDSIFTADSDGFVTMAELQRQTGRSADAILKDLEKLFRKGYFHDCSLERGGEPRVIIANAKAGESGIGFAEVSCPHCGGTTRIRAGSRGKCAYCGSDIKDA